uniref:LRRCT domain-containing protein n=1 Tax=Branchiostoma floridae TaxID=7739 RepID=C3Z8U9_BRAFL|eukprot:XP_002595037.1 hypothetical protein BRAFLDRAFT_99688 [Branchiostoma floridae]
MPMLRHLDLSDNRLKDFPWPSLRNVSRIMTLKLHNNEIAKVDSAFLDFPPYLKYLYLQSNRITTIVKTFLDGLKPQHMSFYLRIWQNPFLCDCKIQWLARLRRCVWEHRDEGCVNAPLPRVRACMLANCNFHPNDVPIILDGIQREVVVHLAENALRCDSPRELKGKSLQNVSLSTCTSPNPQRTLYLGKAGNRDSEKNTTAETELPTLTLSWERTTASTSQHQLIWWKGEERTRLDALPLETLIAMHVLDICSVAQSSDFRRAHLNVYKALR